MLDTIVLPLPRRIRPYLYADRGYDGEPAQRTIRRRGYLPRVRRKRRKPGRPPKHRRWIVEVAHSWFNRFRKLLVRYEKSLDSYLALLHLAAAIICWRKIGIIYG